METKSLEYILEIARCRSVTKAAKSLGISQSALSQILLRVERESGSKLFTRKKRALQLTEAGELYIDAADRIVAIKNKLNADIMDLSGAKRIRFGVTSHWGMLMMLDILPKFHEKYPDTPIELRQYNYRSLRDEYRRYSVDIGVTTLSSYDPLPESCEILREEEMMLIVSRDHPFSTAHAGDSEISESVLRFDLDGMNFIRSAEGSVSRTMENDLFKRIGLAPRTFCEVTDYITFINLVEANLGFAFVSADYIGLSDKVCAWHLSPRMMRKNALLIRPGFEISDAEKYLVEEIRNYKLFKQDANN